MRVLLAIGIILGLVYIWTQVYYGFNGYGNHWPYGVFGVIVLMSLWRRAAEYDASSKD